MIKEDLERRLTAILSADAVGYSRLMRDDDEYTVNTITSYREIISDLINKHHGRVVDAPGDNILAEFGSSLNAVLSAIEIQETLETENCKMSFNRRMSFRIGINLGDILHKDDRIYGDGVNIAARLEGLAKPGGVCISGKVFDEVRNNIDVGFDSLGEKQLKNIETPIQIYQWICNDSDTVPGSTLSTRSSTVPEKPSIAVLPFDNMSGDPEQEYFVNGITEDVITDLSKISGLLVISRYSSFAYKGKAVKAQQISKDLGAQYLVEGSVRKFGNRIRLTAQLIDGSSGGHLWADRYDRELTNVFLVQDEITESIVKSLKVAIAPLERVAIERIPTSNPEAYDFYLRGRDFLNEMTLKNLEHARLMFLKAAAIDPEYALAFAGIADCDSILFMHYSPANSVIEDALANCQKALDLDPNLSEAHASRGIALSLRGDVKAGEKEFNKAIAIDPMLYEAYWYFGLVRAMYDDLKTASRMFKRASQVRGADLQSLMMQMTCYRGMGYKTEMESVAHRAYEIANRRLKLNPDDSRAAYIGATALANLNEKKKAIDWGNLAAEISSDDPRTQYNLACLFSMLGKTQTSLDHLEKSIKNGRPVAMMKWAKADPDLSSIRGEKRFQDLMKLWQGFESK